MKLISKKTPFLIAGAEAVRRKVQENQRRAAKKARRTKLLILGALGATAGGIFYAKKRSQADKDLGSFQAPPAPRQSEEIKDLRKQPQAVAPKSPEKAESGASTAKSSGSSTKK